MAAAHQSLERQRAHGVGAHRVVFGPWCVSKVCGGGEGGEDDVSVVRVAWVTTAWSWQHGNVQANITGIGTQRE